MNKLSLEALEDRSLLSVSAGANSEPGWSSPPTSDIAAASATGSPAAIDNTAQAAPAVGLAAITSVRDGRWSDPAIWSGGRVPGPSDDVILANNVTIDHAQVHELDINAGTATLAGDLQAFASVVVRSRLVGTQGGIFFHVADDRLFTGNTTSGPDPTMPDFHPEDTGLWVLRGGSIDLEGAAVSSWLNALGSGPLQDLGKGVSQQVAFHAGSETLQSAPVGWQAGDTLLLVNEHGESRMANLVSVNGSSIQYHEQKANPTDADLVGNVLVTNGSNTTVYSKIANLTRRIQVVGADVHEGDTNHRAQTTILDGASAILSNVEFRDLGPRGKVGRSPVYFDQGGAVTSSLTGSSIWQDVSDPGNRFVSLHDVQGVTVANNVAFRSRGDGFFMEDSSDYGNSVVNNLSVEVTGDEELPNADSEVTQLTHHYWLRTGNTISGNVAAGGDAVGMIILASTHPGTSLVSNTQVLGAGLFGMWTGTPNVTFDNPVAVFNTRAGFASEPAWDVDSHGAVLNNPLFLFNGTSDSAYGSQIYLNDSDIITVNGGVLAGVKAVHTHYHSTFVVANAKIDVDTLLTPTYWEQAGTFDHDSIQASLLFERAYPAPRYVSPGIVRFTATAVQIGNAPAEVETADYMGDTFQNYPALQGTPIPNAIELDQPAPPSGFIRVTLLPDDERWMTNIARWTVTPIGQTPVHDTFIYQRQTAWSQLASFGGYPDGFPPGQYAVNLYTDSGTLLKSGFAVVRSGQVSDLQDSLTGGPSQVVGRELFYNNSIFDGNSPAASPADDNAIATNKSAYLPNGTAATMANFSSYSKGINGIMVDLSSGGAHSAITLANILKDFTFKVGNNVSPNLWASAPDPIAVTVRPNTNPTGSGSDRVELIWADGAIRQQWLQVTVKATANTGLATDDVFYFGNEIGNTGLSNTPSVARTGGGDVVATQSHVTNSTSSVSVTNVYDFDRDGKVGASDVAIAQTHGTTNSTGLQLNRLSLGGLLLPRATSAAEAANDTGAGAAWALASVPAPPAAPSPPVQQSIANLSSHADIDDGPRAAFFARLAREGTAQATTTRAEADLTADATEVEDEVFDVLPAGLD